MCTDGNCINLSLRCNSLTECSDHSDEEDCSIVHVPTSYMAHIPPTDGDTATLQRFVSLNDSFSIKRFRNIIDSKHSLEIEFTLSTTWRDPRVIFYNLKNDCQNNKLSADEINRLWKPSMFFDNTQDEGVRELKKSARVTRESPSLPSNFNSAEMETTYAGDGAFLVLSQHYSGTFSCRFNVFKYPFDQQECSVVLSSSSGHPYNLTVNYVGPETLHEFRVTDFTITMDEKEQRSIMKVNFRLHRLSNFIMFSVLLPTVMLQIIGYATLFVKPNLLQVRLTITLTTLLVLYTLFSQTSSALPKTSYSKVIDIWFFFCITVLFCIIILHVFVDRLDNESSKSDHTRLNQVVPESHLPLKAPIGSQACHLLTNVFRIPTDPPERMLFVARTYVFPLVVIPITVIFWGVMNRQ